MKQRIELKQLEVLNIKGLGVGKSIAIELLPQHFIKGPNGIGKTTLLDTIMWLLTGQTDLNNKKFDPLTALPGFESKESFAKLTLTVAGITHTVMIEKDLRKKILKYYIDGKNFKKAEYETQLTTWGLDHVRLLSNPHYLLGYLTWQEARAVITEFIKQPEDSVIDTKISAKYGVSNTVLTYGHSKSWNKQTMSDNLNIKKGALEVTNTNIKYEEEKLQAMTENTDTPILEARRDSLIRERKGFENSEKIAELADMKNQLETYQLTNIKIKDAYEVNTRNLNATLERKSTTIVSIDNEIKAKTTKYQNEITLDFTDTCGTCGHKLSEELMKGMREVRNNNASAYLKELEDLKAQKDIQKAEYLEAQTKLKLLDIDEYNKTLEAISNTKNKLDQITQDIAKHTNTDELARIDKELVEINKKLSYNTDVIKDQITKLTLDKDNIVKEIETIEAAIKAIEYRFKLITMEIENQLGEFFPGLDLELEKHMKNGSVKPAFTVSIKGIDYKDLNTANKFKAGVIMSLGLQKLLDINVPLLIDNAEGIDNNTWRETVPMTTQFIMTEVTK